MKYVTYKRCFVNEEEEITRKISNGFVPCFCRDYILYIIYAYSYIYTMYIIYYIYIYIHMSSHLSPHWLCCNSCTSAHDVRLHIAGVNEPKRAQQDKQHNISDHKWSATHRVLKSHRSKMNNTCNQQYVIIHHVAKCMIYHKNHCGDYREGTSLSWLDVKLCPFCFFKIWVPCVSWITYR